MLAIMTFRGTVESKTFYKSEHKEAEADERQGGSCIFIILSDGHNIEHSRLFQILATFGR